MSTVLLVWMVLCGWIILGGCVALLIGAAAKLADDTPGSGQ